MNGHENPFSRGGMVENTKLCAFFLWEYSGHQNTLELWYCAEDIASFLDRCGIYEESDLFEVLKLNRNEREYRAFIRHLAYRIHLYTGILEDGFNWYTAEKLLNNGEWRSAVCALSKGMRDINSGVSNDYKIMSPLIKNYYSN